MRTEHEAKKARCEGAALAHQDAYPNGKAAAIDNGVTYRTERRWRKPRDAQGSPAERDARYIEQAEWPERLLAHYRAKVWEKRYRVLTKTQVISFIRSHMAEDSVAEGEENASRVRRGIPPLQRAALHERDAGHDIRLSALWQRAHDLGITEADVFGALPSEEFGR